MIVASIDIGTNTVLLLVADLDLKTNKIIPIKNEYRMPRIGKGTKKNGFISSERLNLLYTVLDGYDRIIKNYHCEQIIVTGTNAFRIASNTPSIVAEVKERFGYKLNVISGEEEAEYAYLGAISGLENTQLSAVIDIGGSSTEIIVGEGDKVISKKSLQLGSVSATEQFLLHSPPHKNEVEALMSEIKKQLSKIDSKQIPEFVIGIAGTATTIAGMATGMKIFDENIVNNSTISFKDLTIFVEELKSFAPAEILDKYGSIMNGREDIIFAGVYILNLFMETFYIQKIKVSTRGIQYGAIVNYIQNKINQ